MGKFDERLSEIEAKSYHYEFKLYNKEGIEISKGESYKFKGKSPNLDFMRITI